MTAPSPQALLARIVALEARVRDLEGHFETIYRMRRDVTGIRITLARVAAQAGVQDATDEEIDTALDE